MIYKNRIMFILALMKFLYYSYQPKGWTLTTLPSLKSFLGEVSSCGPLGLKGMINIGIRQDFLTFFLLQVVMYFHFGVTRCSNVV